MYYKFIKYILILAVTFSCNSQSNNSIEIYKNTPVWHLAKAVKNENLQEIKNIISEDPKVVMFPEGFDLKFKDIPSLLIWTIVNKKYNSYRELLDLGSNPNFLTTNKKTPLIYICDYIGHGNLVDINYVIALLEKGANPNYIKQGYFSNEGHTIHGESPLIIACQTGNLELVKLLIEKGADPNGIAFTPKNESKSELKTTPLKAALGFKRMSVSKFLIIDMEVNIDNLIQLNDEGKTIDIIYYLRNLMFLVDTKNYILKQEIISFIENKGVNYRNSPIPNRAINYAKKNYPDTWKKYLKNY